MTNPQDPQTWPTSLQSVYNQDTGYACQRIAERLATLESKLATQATALAEARGLLEKLTKQQDVV